VIALLAVLPPAAHAALSIDWYSIDGGGGTVYGGSLTVCGTTGQPDATNKVSAGTYELTGGLWGLPAMVPGDISGDGFVDVADLLCLAGAFGSRVGDPEFHAACDLNVDGVIDVSDLLILARYWGT
jgi:hypothetical protein